MANRCCGKKSFTGQVSERDGALNATVAVLVGRGAFNPEELGEFPGPKPVLTGAWMGTQIQPPPVGFA
jgi:hypothetical protein